MFARSQPVTFFHWTKRPWWLLVLLALTCVANSKEARGACGDYLIVGISHGSAGSEQSWSLSPAIFQPLLSTSSTVPSWPASPSWPSSPCRGPNCGRSPVHETVPHAIVLIRWIEKLACVEILCVDSQQKIDFLSDCNPGPLSPAPVQEIFHPPRVELAAVL